MVRIYLFVAVVVLSSIAFDVGDANQQIAILNQRTGNLERSMTAMRQMTNMLTARITNLETLTRNQAATINRHEADIAAISESNEELLNQNTQLETMLGTFERYFSTLMVENPESFDPTRNAMERISSLNAFLGNSEAQLAGLRPDPVTVPANDTVDQESLGRALAELETVNTDLKQKVDKLTLRVDNSATAAGDRSLTGGSSDIFTLSQCADKLNSLQAQLNALTSVELSKDAAAESDRLGSGSDSAISDTDRRILEGAVYGTARGVNSVRKSVFSVASTRPTLGRTSARQVPFDYIYVNKGGHWNSTSHTFEVGITGYYNFYFSMRSYDGYYMGVTLMKNDDYVTAMYTEADTRNVMESQGVILGLEIGDRVWLRLGPSTTFAIHSDTYRYCTFSGFLVYKGL